MDYILIDRNTENQEILRKMKKTGLIRIDLGERQNGYTYLNEGHNSSTVFAKDCDPVLDEEAQEEMLSRGYRHLYTEMDEKKNNILLMAIRNDGMVEKLA